MSARAKTRSRKAWTAADRRRLAIGLGVVVGAFGIGYAVTALSFNRASGSDVVTVPDLREMTVAEARRALARSELELALADSFPNATLPAGSVLAQSPLPGQEVSPASEVEVFLSTGPPRPTVPGVAGMSAALATTALQTAGFDVLVQDTAAAEEAGRVVGTEPAAGSSLPLPATVRLWVSTGPPRVEMPAVIGMVEADARATLEAAGFAVGAVDYEVNEFGEPGGVVGQEPAPGDSVQLGAEIRLRVVSPGPAASFGGDFDRGRRARGRR